MSSTDRDFVKRQLAFARSTNSAALIDRIRQQLGDEAAATAEEITSGSAADTPWLYAQLQLSLPDLTSTELVSALATLREDARAISNPGLRIFEGLQQYIFAIAAVATMLLGAMVLSALPAVEQMLIGFGQGDLPPLTELLMNPLVQVFLFGLPAVGVSGLALLRRTAQRSFELVAPTPVALAFACAPFRTFRRWLANRMLQILVEGEVANAAALGACATVLTESKADQQMLECLRKADVLGQMNQESQWWKHHLESQLIAQLAALRDLLTIIIQVITGAAVALIVIGLYLPIFQIGSIVS